MMSERNRKNEDDTLTGGAGRVDALWVHGLLSGLAEPSAARVDRMERFVAALRDEPEISRRVWLSRRALVGVALAASLLVALGVVLLESRPARASAESLVRQAQDAHRSPVDRLYRVRWESLPDLETLSPVSETELWTRGDRFWMKIHGRRMACGRNERGEVWVARTRKTGMRFDPNEALPEELAITCAICTMRVETLLRDVLRDYDLKREASWLEGDISVDAIRATLRPGREGNSVKSAYLEIDARSHAVRRFVIERHDTTVTYTLIETGALDEDQYRLEGHLDLDARVYTRLTNPELRQQKLREPRGE